MPDIDGLIQDVTESLGNLKYFSPAIQELVRSAYDEAIGWSFVVSLCFAAVGLVASFFIREKTLGGKG